MAIQILNTYTTWTGGNGWYESTATNNQPLRVGLTTVTGYVWVTKIKFQLDKKMLAGSKLEFKGIVNSGNSSTARMYILSQENGDIITGQQCANLNSETIPTGMKQLGFSYNTSDSPTTEWVYQPTLLEDVEPGIYYAIIRRSPNANGYHEMKSGVADGTIVKDTGNSSNIIFVKVDGHWQTGNTTMVKTNGTWT